MTRSGRDIQDIGGLASLLQKAKLDLGAEDVMDSLWLAAHMGETVVSQTPSSGTQSTPSPSPSIREEFVDEEDEDGEKPELPLVLPQTPSGKQQNTKKPVEGMPFKAPAAPALRFRLELARALRPLRRTVPSPVRKVFDEEATVTRIADQGITSPVLTPAPERWLDLALVVEETRATPIWQETIAEFQTLAERQGAFRTVSTWRLVANTANQPELFPSWRGSTQAHRPHSYKQLWDAAGRRLVLVMSDCISEMWWTGKMQLWLEKLGERSPFAVVQLFPERLWTQTALGQGLPVRLGASGPAKPTAKLKAKSQLPFFQLFQPPKNKQPSQIKVPVFTLEEEPLKQWAKMLGDAGSNRAVGVQFDREKTGVRSQELREKTGVRSQESEDKTHPPSDSRLLSSDSPNPPSDSRLPTSEFTAQERVKHFQETASLMAQQLAGLMAAAPVSPPIVHLIRQTMLRKAKPTHVAEVFMGGLIEIIASGEGEVDQKIDQSGVQYDFAEGVRDLLIQTISLPKAEKVLDTISEYISRRLGLSTKSFEALLAIDFQANPEKEQMVLPFANVTTQVLRRMGGDYGAIADRLETVPKMAPPIAQPSPDDLFPLLQSYTFREATISFEQSVTASLRGGGRLGAQATQVYPDELEDSTEAEHIQTRYRLTDREIEVWSQRQQYRTTTEIAETLGISEHLVEQHIESIRVKQYVIDNFGEDIWPKSVSLETATIQRQTKQSSGTVKFADMVKQINQVLSQQTSPTQLTKLQVKVLRGAWQGQTYKQMAEKSDIDAGTLKRQGFELWQFLSDVLGANVTKVNCRRILSRSKLLQSGLEAMISQSVSGQGQAEFVIQRRQRRAWQFDESITEQIQLEMVLIPQGTFTMGSPKGEEGRQDTEAQHDVTISPFFMGKYPITQAQWRAVAALPQIERELDTSPSHFSDKEDSGQRPVEQITWYQSVEFCARLSAATGRDYRLPSESEWEYACRAGSTTPFHFGETISSDLANYRGDRTYNNGPQGTHRAETTPVGSFPANAFGLYDMHGNVWEWCADHWHENYKGAPTNNTIWPSSDKGSARVLRGGSWDYVPEDCRSAARYGFDPVSSYDDIGLRVVCAASGT